MRVYKNPNTATRKFIPFVVDIQADVLHTLASRVVVPLHIRVNNRPTALHRLNPIVTIDSREYVVMTQELAAIPAKLLDKPVGSLASERSAIINAIDMLFTGF